MAPGCRSVFRSSRRLARARARPRAASCFVFASLHTAHTPCRLSRSSVPPSARGTMWSAMVDVTVHPGPPIAHVGSRRNTRSRSVRQARVLP